MRKLGSYAILLLPLALALGGCDSFADPENGSITLLLTDAPGDVRQAWVTIDRIYLQSGAGAPTAGTPGVDLMTDDITVDLMTLADDIEGLVEDAVVPAGVYAQLRVVVTGACVVVETDVENQFDVYATSGYTQCGQATGILQAPSLAQTGIKVLMDGGAVEVSGNQQVLLLDFDVSQSFGRSTGGMGWVMEPVIRGGEIGLTASITANLSTADGVSLPAGITLGDFVADLSTEEADAAFTDPDGDGVYSAVFEYILPDAETDFVVTVVRPAGTDGYTVAPESAIADVVSGADAVVNFTVNQELQAG